MQALRFFNKNYYFLPLRFTSIYTSNPIYCANNSRQMSEHKASTELAKDDNVEGQKVERIPKHIKRALNRAKRKKAERERLAEKRAEHRIQSLTNDSDVLSTKDLVLTSYYCDKGLRKVYPYIYEFRTHAKGRWFGKTVKEILSSEFNKSKECVLKHIESGRVTVNEKTAMPDYIFKANDLVVNNVHRHELPVSAEPIEIIENTDEMLVVNKPCSIPIHPCGKYRYNSLTYILAIEHGLRNLRCLYRLDRMTSGVMMFCKIQGRANDMILNIQKRQNEKTYVCRVQGEFPEGEVECHEPLKTLDHAIGLQQVATDGKESHTTFERLSYNGRSSVVKCLPHTGRTHQIRVHLQYLGHPILNDYLYNNTEVWGPHNGKNADFGKTHGQLLKDIHEYHNAVRKLESPEISDSLSKSPNSRQCTSEEQESGEDSQHSKNQAVGDSQKLDPASLCRSIRESHDNSGELETVDETAESCTEIKIDSGLLSSKHKLDESDNLETDSRQQNEKRIKLDTDAPGSETELNSENQQTPKSANESGVPPQFDPDRMTFDPGCDDCRKQFRDPQPSQMVMYLHALRNKGPDWDYSTKLPKWAEDDWPE